jgi:hypothetical protein
MWRAPLERDDVLVVGDVQHCYCLGESISRQIGKAVVVSDECLYIRRTAIQRAEIVLRAVKVYHGGGAAP